MKKLLLHSKTKGGGYAENVTSQRTKNSFLAFEALNYFLPKHGKQPDYSTLFRMNYLHKPIAGLLFKTQLFSGRVSASLFFGSGGSNFFEHQNKFSSLNK